MKQSKRTPLVLAVLSFVGLWLWFSAPTEITMIQTTTDTDIIALPSFGIAASLIAAIAYFVMLAATAVSGWWVFKLNHKTPRWAVLTYGLALVLTILVQNALTSEVGGWGKYFLAVVVLFFAFTSIIGNYAYCESAMVFLGLGNASAIMALRMGLTAGFALVWPLLLLAQMLHAIAQDLRTTQTVQEQLDKAQGLLLTETFYWDLNDNTRAFSKRFSAAQGGKMPSMVQAGVYSSVIHYLKAVDAAKTDDGTKVAAKMKELPTDDPIFGKSDLGLVSAWKATGASVELHLYAKGGHGYGYAGVPGTTTVHWPEQFLAWLRANGF